MELNISIKIHIWHCFIELVDDENYITEYEGNMIIIEGNIKQKNLKIISLPHIKSCEIMENIIMKNSHE